MKIDHKNQQSLGDSLLCKFICGRQGGGKAKTRKRLSTIKSSGAITSPLKRRSGVLLSLGPGGGAGRRGVHPSRTPLSPQLCFRGTRIRFYLLPRCSGAISCLSADRGYARLVYPRTSVAQPRVADRRGNTMMMLPRLADTAPNVSEDRGYASPV